MPAAAVTAAGAVAVGYMQHRSASNAAKTQKQATDAALAHETGRESIDDQRYAAREEQFQKDLADWKQRHGYGSATPAAGVHASSAQPTIRDLAPGGMTAMGSAQPQAMGSMPTLADTSKWNEWDQYLTPAGRA